MSSDVDVKLIGRARDMVTNAKCYDDYIMAVFMVRDLETTKAAGLSDAAWALYRNCCSKNDVIWLIEKLEEYMEGER